MWGTDKSKIGILNPDTGISATLGAQHPSGIHVLTVSVLLDTSTECLLSRVESFYGQGSARYKHAQWWRGSPNYLNNNMHEVHGICTKDVNMQARSPGPTFVPQSGIADSLAKGGQTEVYVTEVTSGQNKAIRGCLGGSCHVAVYQTPIKPRKSSSVHAFRGTAFEPKLRYFKPERALSSTRTPPRAELCLSQTLHQVGLNWQRPLVGRHATVTL